MTGCHYLGGHSELGLHKPGIWFLGIAIGTMVAGPWVPTYELKYTAAWGCTHNVRSAATSSSSQCNTAWRSLESTPACGPQGLKAATDAVPEGLIGEAGGWHFMRPNGHLCTHASHAQYHKEQHEHNKKSGDPAQERQPRHAFLASCRLRK